MTRPNPHASYREHVSSEAEAVEEREMIEPIGLTGMAALEAEMRDRLAAKTLEIESLRAQLATAETEDDRLRKVCHSLGDQLATARKSAIAECAKCVPTNWCDELLTGKGVGPFADGRPIEALLRGVQDRIRALNSGEQKQSDSGKGG